MSTTKTIQVLRHLFATYGIPEQLVSDNALQFISKESNTCGMHLITLLPMALQNASYKLPRKLWRLARRNYTHHLEFSTNISGHPTLNQSSPVQWLLTASTTPASIPVPWKKSEDQVTLDGSMRPVGGENQWKTSQPKATTRQESSTWEFFIVQEAMARNLCPRYFPGVVVQKQGICQRTLSLTLRPCVANSHNNPLPPPSPAFAQNPRQGCCGIHIGLSWS